jgi:glutaredoxin
MSIQEQHYSDAELIRFGQCLQRNNFVVYSIKECPYCKKQKEILGAGYRFIKEIVCDSSPQVRVVCEMARISGYPTFIKKAKSGHSRDLFLGGMQQLSDLARESGCPLPIPLE